MTLPQGIRPTNQKEYFKVLRHWSSRTPEVAALPPSAHIFITTFLEEHESLLNSTGLGRPLIESDFSFISQQCPVLQNLTSVSNFWSWFDLFMLHGTCSLGAKLSLQYHFWTPSCTLCFTLTLRCILFSLVQAQGWWINLFEWLNYCTDGTDVASIKKSMGCDGGLWWRGSASIRALSELAW